MNVLEVPVVSAIKRYPGQRLGHYHLVKLLAQGGSGSIYLARHQHLGTLAAVKVLHTQLDGDDLRRFQEEARTAAQFDHVNIVRVLDFGVENGISFLVMDYAPYNTLRERYREGVAYSPSTILEHVQQMSSALQYIHELGFIHRDVKPDNMLLGKEYQALLSDFGISTATLPDNVLTAVSRVGTVAYMAPEQIVGKACPASDQYALGVVTYEWLSGTNLFHGTTLNIARQHMHTMPEPLRNHVRGIAPAVEQVVLKALAKKPEERFNSVQEFALALRRATEENDDFYNVTPNVNPNALLLATDGTDMVPAASGERINRKQKILERSLQLLVCDLFIGLGVFIALIVLRLPPFSLALLFWLTLLSAPMIYTWSMRLWSASIFTVTSFAVSAIVGFLVYQLAALVGLYSFLLFVGFYMSLCLRIRSAEKKGA